MSNTYTKQPLSGAANGLPIKIAAIASPGTTIHTAVASASALDEIWLWVINTSANAVTITLQWGDTVSPDSEIIYTVVPKDGLKCLAPGLLLRNGLIVKGYASVANVLQVHGFVNAIT